MKIFAEMRRLHDRGPFCRGLAVDADGAMLGPDWALISRTVEGYRPASIGEIRSVLSFAFGAERDALWLCDQLNRIATTLDHGDIAKAQILGLQIAFGALNDLDLLRLDVASALVKAGYNPDQPRDDNGQWSSGSGSNNSGIIPVQYAVPIPPPFIGPFGNSLPEPADDEDFPPSVAAPGLPANADAQSLRIATQAMVNRNSVPLRRRKA